jgi:His-Xaa-Ser system radical SAM maturase HxsC
MLKLGGKVIRIEVAGDAPMPKRDKALFTISTNAALPKPMREWSAYLMREADSQIPTGFAHYIWIGEEDSKPQGLDGLSVTVLPEDYSYMQDGDIIRLNSARGEIRVLFRKNSPHNTIMVTEQCQHYCLMCSQPPKDIDDRWLLDEANDLIRMMPRGTGELGFSGGEPTLFGNDFLETLKLTKSLHPGTSVHILSNGRRFADRRFAADYAKIEHPDMMVGIPIYSDDPAIHDYVVQAKGAFDETIRGILNLKEFGQKVELRVVIHKLTIDRLEKLAEYLARNLLFLDHVALMGLEITGFTRANLDKLWIDPHEYRDTLSKAVRILEDYGMHVSVYNHPLCLVNPDVSKAYRKSISDWKNEYLDACTPCTRKSECGGFFSSGVKYRHSGNIRPFV